MIFFITKTGIKSRRIGQQISPIVLYDFTTLDFEGRILQHQVIVFDACKVLYFVLIQ